MSGPTHISIRGARVHNLRDVDLDVPRDSLVVFTGVSGSGKSSLAFETIYKEGQRRFVESLSAYARQFLGQMERPDVDSVEGVSPTVSIDQKTVNRNPRSTVGTVTEVADHLRLLMARLGSPHCPICSQPVSKLSAQQIVDEIVIQSAGRRTQILSPIIQSRKGEYRKELQELRADGWVRVRVDGQVRSLEEDISLARYEKHTIEIVVDRLKPSIAERTRVAEAVEVAILKSGGIVVVLFDDEERTYAIDRACVDHPEISIPELEPRLFSFNAPQGACPSCNGLGVQERFELDRLVDIAEPLPGAFKAWNDQGKVSFSHLDVAALKRVVKRIGADWRKPLVLWSADHLQALLVGDPLIRYKTRKERASGRVDEVERQWVGLLGVLERVWHFTRFPGFQKFRVSTPCDACSGTRLNAVARSVTFRGKNVPQLLGMNIRDARAFFDGVALEDGDERSVGAQLVAEIQERLVFLDEVGLGYLTLDRRASTLSGGEAQRIRLASQVGSGLQGVTYVLDEPSIGLHARDNQRLLTTLLRLRDRGNSVLVVEHDEETIRAADFVVDVGPGAGTEGGHVLASTTPGRFVRMKRGVTARYLRGEECIPVPDARRAGNGQVLEVRGARLNNLKDVQVSFPLGTFCVVTGVSGSGKSSLVLKTLVPAVHAVLQGVDHGDVSFEEISGVEHVDKLIRINQQPIGRTPRSNPGTYTGAFDIIRDLFASTPESRARGYRKGRFSFNVKGGRCEACQGAGVKTVEMQFLPSVAVPCDICSGRRFNEETLEVTYRGHTIFDVLEMPISQALETFGAIPKLRRILQTMVDVGLGYVRIGQPSTTLSGGEAQRVKLATELHRPATGQTVYVLDEPTTGLHFQDVSALLRALQRLVDQGNTVIVVEHHVDVIRCADVVIDLGPDGGDAGGQIIGIGTPEDIALLDTPTGRALAAVMTDAPVEMVMDPQSTAELYRAVERDSLSIRGARLHNLQGVNCDIPHDKMTVITGVSGSGKTSLAFDTIFAEGQRRYVESMSTYARRFLGRVDRAPLDGVEGLKPAIAIDQKSASHNPRSTVATVTEIHDVLRSLYARIGEQHCPDCDRHVRGYSPSEAARFLSDSGLGTGWVTASLRPLTLADERRKGLVGDGWVRLLVRSDGGPAREINLSDEPEEANAALQAGADLVVDRLNPKRAPKSRLAEAIRVAYSLGGGAVAFVERGATTSIRLTELAACPDHGPVLGEAPNPRHFSFNSRLGACPECQGLGKLRQITRHRLFPQPSKPFWEAIDGKTVAHLKRSRRTVAMLNAVLDHCGVQDRQPMRTLTEEQWRIVLDGCEEPVDVTWTKRWSGSTQRVEESRPWKGLRGVLRGWNTSLDWLVDEDTCPSCGGARLSAPVRSTLVGGLPIHAFTQLSVQSALAVVKKWNFEGEKALIADRIQTELISRLTFLVDVGLGYLSLDRTARSLSGGESQRIRLASQLGSKLTGVMYVLDEPTVGLHPRDTARLLSTLEGLRDLGNTVILVEHDPDTIVRADHVLDLGPGAGIHGGQLLAAGSPADIAKDRRSVTGAWLAGREVIDLPDSRRKARGSLQIRGARGNNLKGVDVDIDLGVWVAVTGVSGSGKSSLIMDTLVPALAQRLGQIAEPLSVDAVEVQGAVERLVVVDQQPIGRSPRSTPATYTKVLDPIRKLFASTTGAMERGWKASRFSFNTAGGRCETCEGRGSILVEMHFLPDVWLVCESCAGRRYNRETLEVRWKGKTIADVLSMRIDEAAVLFENHRQISRKLKPLVDVGLGYLSLGQPGNTLSGGEAQRVKLASELTARRKTALYVLDEPTTGLHLEDVRKLVKVLHALVDSGHSVLTIEHHLDVIAQADQVIDLGPEGGDAGGLVVATGHPRGVAEANTATGISLKGWFDERQAREGLES